MFKYKRDHFATQEEFERFKMRRTKAQKRWLEKSENLHPEKRKRRLLRQRLYSYYYSHTDGRQPFADWVVEKFGNVDLKNMPLDDLKDLVDKC